MFLFDFFMLAVSWILFFASERILPTLHSSLTMRTDWATFLFFKPFHLILSFLCFMSAFLILRGIILKHCQTAMGRGKKKVAFRFMGFIFVLLGLGLAAEFLFRHFLPSMILITVMAVYEGAAFFFAIRKKKRLKTAFRQLQ